MIASTFALAAFAAFSAVQGIPLPQLATVEASLSTPNATQYNASVVSYEMNGNAGACGWYNKDADVVVGLPNEFYEDLSSVSAYCGKFVVVVDPRQNNTVTALVADASTSNETLSLSQGTWNALNGTDSDLKFVDWRFANETETAEAKKALASGSSSAPSSTSYAAPSSSSAAQQQQQEAPSSSSVAPSSTQKAATSAKPTTTTEAYKAPSTTSYAPKTTTTTYQAPKATTTQAQATKQVQQASSASSGTYSGQATFYSQGGAAGSCGNYASDSDYVVAVNAAQMNSGWCGRKVTVTNKSNGKTITATVADTCPGCSYGSLDLSTGAFGAIGSYDTGVLPIAWNFS
ncbi:hypothetical protein JCM9279_005579 [Rhodotorula babjevae]